MAVIRDFKLRDGCRHQNGWIFRKVPNGLWTPHPTPHFQKIMWHFFYNFMLKKPCLKVQNLHRKHIRFGDGIRPLWNNTFVVRFCFYCRVYQLNMGSRQTHGWHCLGPSTNTSLTDGRPAVLVKPAWVKYLEAICRRGTCQCPTCTFLNQCHFCTDWPALCSSAFY